MAGELVKQTDQELLKSQNNKQVTFAKAQIKWANFAGAERQYNAEGDRNFHVVLEEEQATLLADMGLNVKSYIKANDPDAVPEYSLKVHIGFKARTPPIVQLIGSKNKTNLPEEDLIFADWAEIDHVNLIVNLRYWENNGSYGIKVWLKAIYIEIRENEFEAMYADLPEVAAYDALEAAAPDLDLGELNPFEQGAIGS